MVICLKRFNQQSGQNGLGQRFLGRLVLCFFWYCNTAILHNTSGFLSSCQWPPGISPLFFFGGGWQKKCYSMSCVSISQGCHQLVCCLATRLRGEFWEDDHCHFCGQNLSKTWHTFTDNLHLRKQARSLMQQWLQQPEPRIWSAVVLQNERMQYQYFKFSMLWVADAQGFDVNNLTFMCPTERADGPHHRAWKQGPYAGGDAGGKFLRETEAGVQGDSAVRHSRSIRIILWLNPENYSHPWMRRKKFKN